MYSSFVVWTGRTPVKGRPFKTAPVKWTDLMEWTLVTAPDNHVTPLFRALAERDPIRAMALLDRGGCLKNVLEGRKPMRNRVPVEATDVLLKHPVDFIRQHAISLLGKAG